MKRIFAVAFTLLCSAGLSQATPQVTIDSGALAGTRDGAIDIYKDIPYAAPPVGALRWEPPAAAAKWQGVRDASAFGAACPQPPRPDAMLMLGRGDAQSEDCLSLNVWAPVNAKNAPVMVWIHGGGHRNGSGASPLYDGSAFARDGVVLVTINYRLGLLGYFAHPALTKAAGRDAPLGNYGDMDQIAALHWVARNIARFGGDPDNVTVAGESAGGESILWLLSTPATKGLYARAIVESGGGWPVPVTLAEKETEGAAFAKDLGLSDPTLAQLRAIPADKTFDIHQGLGFGPFVDGRLYKQTPSQAFASGTSVAVPLLIGSNSFEASLMKVFGVSRQDTLSQMTPRVRALYSGTEKQVAQAAFTDAVMGAPAHWIAGQASRRAPVFLYHFSYVNSRRRESSPGASHGAEIPYAFATGSALAARFGIKLGADDLAMEKLVHGCWVDFVKSGRPCEGWPAYTASGDLLMEFDSVPGPKSGLRKAQYDALENTMLPALDLPAH
jgi:para-nitrobenzyl esterase